MIILVKPIQSTFFVRALRNKLDDDQHPRLIQTVRGVGYVLRADDEK